MNNKDIFRKTVELQKFLHECENVVTEMQEKLDSSSEDLGFSKSSCEEHQLQHEEFVQKLQITERRVVDIRKMSKKLQKKFSNNKIITDKLTVVNETFSTLQIWENSRKNNLEIMMKLFDLHKKVKDQITNLDELLIEVESHDNVLESYDKESMETMMSNQYKMKEAIDSREIEVGSIHNFGIDLKSCLMFASEEIDKILELMNLKFLVLSGRFEERVTFIYQLYLYKEADLQSPKIQNEIEHIKNRMFTAMLEVCDIRGNDPSQLQIDPRILRKQHRKISKCFKC